MLSPRRLQLPGKNDEASAVLHEVAVEFRNLFKKARSRGD